MPPPVAVAAGESPEKFAKVKRRRRGKRERGLPLAQSIARRVAGRAELKVDGPVISPNLEL